MYAAAIIVFRESLEAALVIGIMLAATRGIAMRGRWVLGGILAGLGGAVLVASGMEMIANLVDGMWVVLTVIVAMLLPLSRIVPPIYQFRVRSRIFRWYAQLRRIEEDAGRPDADRQALASELDALEARVEQIAVPLSYADELYSLRSNIGLVRSRLK